MTAPDGYHALTPRIVVADLGAQVQFFATPSTPRGKSVPAARLSFESGTRS